MFINKDRLTGVLNDVRDGRTRIWAAMDGLQKSVITLELTLNSTKERSNANAKCLEKIKDRIRSLELHQAKVSALTIVISILLSYLLK